MRPRVNRTLVPVLLIIALCVIAGNTWFAFRSETVLVESESSVQHTWQVIYQVELILSSAKDAETGARGFLLTGDESYLQPYNQALRELPGELDRFHSLTADNPSQQARLTQIKAVLQLRLGRLQNSIDLRRNSHTSAAQTLASPGEGRRQMDTLRRLGDEADEEERTLLARRTAASRQANQRSKATLGLASGLDFLLIILIFRYLAREQSMRISSEQTAERLAIARAEAEQSAAEVLELNATLEERVALRTAELANTNRELEAFSYSVSHDLRAPLRTIDGFSLALEEDYAAAVDDIGRDYIRRVRSGVQRMGQLIDALLQLSRITRAEIVREEVDLSRMATQVVADLFQSDQRSQVTVHIEKNLHANADPKLVQVALENLLGNAAKFSSKRPNPVIEFGWDPQQTAWFVRDNGAGFDMYYANKLFNAFNRLHGDKDFKGSGIGLATVARVVQQHHGKIWAHGEVDRGATFWFTLG